MDGSVFARWEFRGFTFDVNFPCISFTSALKKFKII